MAKKNEEADRNALIVTFLVPQVDFSLGGSSRGSHGTTSVVQNIREDWGLESKKCQWGLLAKLTWMVVSKRDSLCMQALRSKYKVGKNAILVLIFCGCFHFGLTFYNVHFSPWFFNMFFEHMLYWEGFKKEFRETNLHPKSVVLQQMTLSLWPEHSLQTSWEQLENDD